jgi:DNA-binding NarL/FixJ family response regulator
VRVIVGEDSVLFREGLVRVLRDAGFDVAHQASDAGELLRAVRDDPPDLAIVDVRMPPTNTDDGMVAALRIREEHPEVAVLVLSHHVETQHAMKLVAGGGSGVGYLLKDRVSNLDEFTEAVTRVGAGGSAIDPEIVARLVGRRRRDHPLDALSERERDVLTLMAEGYSNHAIAEKLFLTERTVESHVRNIFTKLGLTPSAGEHRRVRAVLAYLRVGNGA